MEFRFFLSIIVVLLSVTSLTTAACVNNATEISDNKVEIKFYRLQVSEWNSGFMESKFHALLASQADSYCSSHLTECGLTSLASNFKEIDIGKVSDSPKDDVKDMLYEFYINYPENSAVISGNSLQCVLSTATVKNIVYQLRTNTDYISTLGCDKCYITYINDDFYGIPPASLENRIIIPIAFVVLVVIIIVAVCLKAWDKKKEKERKAAMNNVPKKKRAIVQEEYTLASKPPKSTPLPDDSMNDSSKTRKEKMYGGAVGSPHTKQFDRSGGASNDSGLEVESYETKPRKHHSLEPLTTKEDEKTEKKKRKKEKKRSKKSKVEGAENQGYMAEDEGTGKQEMQTDL